jgi:uncharacterized membrane protein
MSPDQENRHQAERNFAIDALRGLIIVAMALDHANRFIAQKHASGEYWGGPFPRYADVLPFMIRLVTHISAPGFFLLMGAGMVLLARARQKAGLNKASISLHLVLRGGLLIALQFFVVNRAWELSPGDWNLETYVGVLFALGGGMIAGALLLWLHPRILLLLTIVLVLGIELLTPAPGQWSETFSTLSRLLLVPGGNLKLWVNYPILPWLELVVFGMVLGHWLTKEPQEVTRRAFIIGGVLLVLFLVLRGLDRFGNIRPRAGKSWIDYLNLVKYPPSITFTLLTTGINLTLLGLFSRMGRETLQFLWPLIVFGRVPLFFYLTHLFLYAGLGLWLSPDGSTIAEMIPLFLLGLMILFPLCWGYGKLKNRQAANSILRFI